MVKNLIIVSFEKVGPFLLNAGRSENRKRYPVFPVEFFKTKNDSVPRDAYDNIGVHIEYNNQDICIAIEISNKANPIFKNLEILRIPFSNLMLKMKSFDKNIKEDEIGFVSHKLGIGIYAPKKGNFPENPAEGVIVFSKDYYK